MDACGRSKQIHADVLAAPRAALLQYQSQAQPVWPLEQFQHLSAQQLPPPHVLLSYSRPFNGHTSFEDTTQNFSDGYAPLPSPSTLGVTPAATCVAPRPAIMISEPDPCHSQYMPGQQSLYSGSLAEHCGPYPSDRQLFVAPRPVERVRVPQACERCRLRKTKCTGTRPSCNRCASRGFPCEYALNHKANRRKNKDKPRRLEGQVFEMFDPGAYLPVLPSRHPDSYLQPAAMMQHIGNTATPPATIPLLVHASVAQHPQGTGTHLVYDFSSAPSYSQYASWPAPVIAHPGPDISSLTGCPPSSASSSEQGWSQMGSMSRIGSYSSGSERLDMSRQGSAWSTASSSSLGMSEVQRSVSKESTDWSESARYPLSWSNLECGVARNAFSGASQSFSQLSQTSFPLRSLAPSNSARGPVPTSEVPMAVPYDTELEASLLAAFSDNSSNHTGSANSINVDALIPPLTSTSLSSLSSSSRDTTLSDRLSFDSRSGSEFATPATSPGSVSFDVQMADASDRSTFTCASSAGSPEDFGNTLRDDLTGSDLSFNDVSKLTPPSSVCPSTMPCSGASSPSPSPNCCSPRIRSLSLDYDQAQLTEKATPHTKKSAHPLTNLFEELFGPEEEDKEEYTGRAPGV